MINTFASMLKNKEIRNRILFTLAMMLVYRLGAAIPAPRIDAVKLLSAGIGQDGILAMMNLLGGGMLQRFSIFALGVGPYITSSIIIQLLATENIIPALSEMTKSGQQGKQQMNKITRYLSVILAFIQAFTMTYAFDISNQIVIDGSVATYLYIATILTAGTMFLGWIGDRITTHGIGNGVSIIIFAGIVSNMPWQFVEVYNTLIANASATNATMGMIGFAAYVFMYIAIIVLVIFMSQAVRKIPIQYTSSAVRQHGNDMTFLPLKINSASVIPVIFASAILTAPLTIMSFFPTTEFTTFMTNILSYTQPVGFVLYILLIVLFTFFYTNLQVDPQKISDNLNKNGTYIPGVRPGHDTKVYVSTILNRITVLGASFLCFIAALPPLLGMIFTEMPAVATLGGTGIIIVVGVALETTKDLTGKLTQRTYHGFIKK